ncbi:MAG: DNA alkylation repair protein [Parvibaculaceae bacterium]|nr:DNA alkylation repair protein [Parvibaculaceae bacterium]HBM88841.1 DNA alkylation repair protein [Rhodobiaceae bacterium]
MVSSLTEVERVLKAAAKGIPKAKAKERAFFMKTKMPLLGLTVPEQRKLAKRGYSFSDLSAQELAAVWTEIWHGAKTHEGKMQAGLALEQFAPELGFGDRWALIRGWCSTINCWDQSDTLSAHVARALEEKPKMVWPVLQAWNSDADPWKRRQSVVGLFFYTRFRAKLPPVARSLKTITALLKDEDYYVQKGVGWALRESYNAYPEQTFLYLKKHAGTIHPDAFSAALEKVSLHEKAEIKKIRKVVRGR